MRVWISRDDIEITMETNPGTVEHGPFADYLRAGVNRISFGVQSFDDAALQRIGRIHYAVEAERAIKMAQDAGYDNINLDLMYALPEQTFAGALADIDKADGVAHAAPFALPAHARTEHAVRGESAAAA